jgi:hypothetical protein
MLRMTGLLALLLALGCSAAPRAEQAGAGEPALALAAAPDVRVIAMELQPQAGALHLAGQFALPRPLLPSGHAVRIEGLDARGEALFAHTVELDVRPGSAFRGGPRTATLRAEVPAPAGLARVRVILPGR